jgi:hypothetical protein
MLLTCSYAAARVVLVASSRRQDHFPTVAAGPQEWNGSADHSFNLFLVSDLQSSFHMVPSNTALGREGTRPIRFFDHVAYIVVELIHFSPLADERILFTLANEGILFPLANEGILFPLANEGILFPLSSEGILFTRASEEILFTLANEGIFFTLANEEILFTLAREGILFTLASEGILFTRANEGIFFTSCR